ncbi:MAG: GDSL-type esterase/lipase family protein [Negativicutes bacterium]|nr:GDSL-type esterase/lipase family protein [Negativicutes bacterium]
MKRTLAVFSCFMLILAGLEYGNIFGQDGYKPALQAELISNEYVISWPKLAYPALYKIEAFIRPPGRDGRNAIPCNIITTFYTWKNSYIIANDFPFRTFWRVSAQGLFLHPLGQPSDPLSLAAVKEEPDADFRSFKPVITSLYSEAKPATVRPMLTWSVLPGAVYYEVEILAQPPENPNGTEPSQYRIAVSREVFTNGYNADLASLPYDVVYWRVRGLNYDGHPLGVFSDTAKVVIDRAAEVSPKPLITTEFNSEGTPTPLYPAYSWIPVYGAVSYEVEITNELPENPDDFTPSRYRIWSKQLSGFACYDEEPRIVPGTYYWRVRGLDAAGNPAGLWSKPGKFAVNPKQFTYAATFGDSITHGGGAVSYSPADWAYSYQTYLSFTAVNLGRSADTAETMLSRFDRDVLPYRPRYLLIMGGTNSLRGGVPASDVIRSLAAIRDRCLAYGIRPIFITLPPINPANIAKVFGEQTAPGWQKEFAAVNAFLRKQRYVVDIAPYFTDANGELPDYLAVDGLHPDIEGKKLMAGIINAHWSKLTK